MKTCLFCSIIDGRERSATLYSDDRCTAFLDVFPVRPGHALVVPNRHVALLTELHPEEHRRLFGVAMAVLTAQRRCGISTDGANLLVNDGSAANQHIPHVHVHVIPRIRGDGARALFTFGTRMINVFMNRASHETLERVANPLRAHIKAYADGER